MQCGSIKQHHISSLVIILSGNPDHYQLFQSYPCLRAVCTTCSGVCSVLTGGAINAGTSYWTYTVNAGSFVTIFLSKISSFSKKKRAHLLA
jgi:hypothetical protein